MKTIKVVIKDETNVFEHNYSYDSKNTFKDLFEFLDIDDCYLDEKNRIYPKDGISVLKYVIHNNQVEWMMPLEECKIEDYVESFNLHEIIFHKPTEIGGTSLPEIDWQSILEALEQGKDFIKCCVIVYKGIKFIKELKEKFMNYKRGCVPIDFVEDFIKERQCWHKNELKMRLRLEEDEGAELFLRLAGYKYDEENDMYVYSEVLSQKNSDKLRECVNEYLKTHDINDIIK